MVHYNLQMIIAVGFKVNNDRAVRFRKWAGQIERIKAVLQLLVDTLLCLNGGYATDNIVIIAL